MELQVLNNLLQKEIIYYFIPRLNDNTLHISKKENELIYIYTSTEAFRDENGVCSDLINDKMYVRNIEKDVYLFAIHDLEYLHTSSHFVVLSNLRDKFNEEHLANLVFTYYMNNERPLSLDEVREELQIFLSSIAMGDGLDRLLRSIVRTDTEIKENLNYLLNVISQRKTEYLNSAKQYEMAMVRAGEININELTKKIQTEFENIIKHKKVISLRYDKEYIIINTVPLTIYEPITKKHYQLGKCKIKIDTTDNYTIKLDSEIHRNAYWNDSPHPHVNQSGNPCWGTADAQIAQMQAEYQYYGIFITALNYLETCNIEDVAGNRITAWDEIDEDGNIIKSEENYDEEENYEEEEEDEDDEEYDEVD